LPPVPLARHAAREAADEPVEEARQYSALVFVDGDWRTIGGHVRFAALLRSDVGLLLGSAKRDPFH
jgi:hypothetical protein